MSRSNRRFGLAALATALVATLAAPASAGYLTSNGLLVEETGNGTFHTRYAGGAAAVDFWCAAGDYAIGKLHVEPRTRIYRASPVKQKASLGVSFSLSEADSVGASGMISFKDDGSMSAALAKEMCQVARLLRQ